MDGGDGAPAPGGGGGDGAPPVGGGGGGGPAPLGAEAAAIVGVRKYACRTYENREDRE